jgi:L-phenylalanine/L-methionine N-acetyltransferase
VWKRLIKGVVTTLVLSCRKFSFMTRKAEPRDFDFIYALHSDPQVNRFLFYEIMSAGEFSVIFDDLLKEGILYVYEEEGVLTGMFKLSPKTHRAAHIISLGGVAIHPSFSGKGCGQRMLNEILLIGKERGFVRMDLGVSSINSKAIRLYEKAGFQREGFLKKFIYLKNENLFLDDILMAYLYE